MKLGRQSTNVEDRRDVHLPYPSLLDVLTGYAVDKPARWMAEQIKRKHQKYTDLGQIPSDQLPQPPYFDNQGVMDNSTQRTNLSDSNTPMIGGTNPQNSIALLIERMISGMSKPKSADVPMTPEEAGALGIPTKQPPQVPRDVKQPPSS